ncbi:MAG: hypothetical protein JWP12_3787 [Bacteroidetes bacterium]|nr:hypothetical protein [Bacteroidota bacterium]
MKITNVVLAVTLALMSSQHMQAQNPAYKIAGKIKLEGDGGWDYLTADDASGKLYVSHGTVTQVVNESTGALIGTIPDTKGVHGITLAKDLNKGFISDGKDTAVTVFDLTTLAVLAKIKVTGINPDAILYDPFSHNVFVYNGRSSNATVIDAITNKVIETIALPGKPEFSATDEKGNVYVNIEDKSKICRINSTTLKVEQTWSIGKGEEPSGLAIDNKNHRLFLVCDNKLMIIMDAQNGTVIASLPIGENVDGAAFDPETERVYSSNGEGTMTVIQGTDGKDYKVLENVVTQKGARTITIDKKTHHLYLPTAEFEAPTDPKQRPKVKAGSFVILDIEPVK